MGDLADRQSCRGSTCHLAEATNPSAIGLAAAVFRLPSPLKQPLRGGKLSPWVLFRLRLQRGGDEIESARLPRSAFPRCTVQAGSGRQYALCKVHTAGLTPFPGEQKYEN